MGADSLARVAGDFFATVMLVSEAGANASAEPSGLRSQLVAQLDALSKSPEAMALEAQELEEARFALVAWADEMLLRSEWPGAMAWSEDLLQTRLFRTNRGGDEFYERLARLRPEQSEARLIYFLCFCFGFEGQLIDHDAERQVLVQQHYDMLRAAGKARDQISSGQISPEAYELEVHLTPPTSGSLVRIIGRWAAIAAGLFVVLYGVLFIMASGVDLPPPSWQGR